MKLTLKTMGDRPHQLVKHPVGGLAEIEVPHHSLEDPGVSPWLPLFSGFLAQFLYHVLSQKTDQFNLLRCDNLWLSCSSHYIQNTGENPGHVIM